jgi:colanic acid/amylovoran biosynthesis glycosyltransferase
MNVTIVQPSLNAVSETFIREHAERLPANVAIVHGNPARIDGRPVLSDSLLRRAVRKVDRIARAKDHSWETTRSFLAAFRRTRPAVVMAEYGTTGVYIMEACRVAKVPLVVHFHGYDASVRQVLETNQAAYREMFRSAAAVVAVSRAMEARLLAIGAPRESLHYNPCGVDVANFGGATPANSAPTFVAVGRFVEKKAPHLTLLAFAEVVRRHPEARLRMIGDGPLKPVCEDLAHGLGIKDAVTFLGPQPPEVVQREMREARAFVQHSVEAASGDCEGTPVAVLEAGASGLPVIATRHAGIPDVVVEGRTGLLVDERDVRGMAEHMCRLVADPNYADELGRAARDRIGHEFTMDRSIDRLWSIIRGCAGQVRPVPRNEAEKPVMGGLPT